MRTKTYIAGDWDHDKKAVEKLYEWKNGYRWNLSFPDAHEVTQARDTSLNCSIKASLKTRLDLSNRFILIVGTHTDTVTAGSCQFCGSYNSYSNYCARGRGIDYRSFIKYECDEARKAYFDGNMRILVLYNSCSINKGKCPESLRNIGVHAAMGKMSADGNCYWDYDQVKEAFDMM